ncbi:hypothetical protein ACFQ3W_11435 [Paenibacillus puldeungensis]|uniref:YqzN/YkzM domain-containing protein n=1 Tax=Paenibacillus puldeungensis TaxID=696536 RepID=A0ABW3RWP6_9BACL
MAARKGATKEATKAATPATQAKKQAVIGAANSVAKQAANQAETQAATRSTEGSKPAASASTISPSYPIHELMAESEALLGVKPEVFAGALEGATKETLQVKEAKQLVEQFLRKKVL